MEKASNQDNLSVVSDDCLIGVTKSNELKGVYTLVSWEFDVAKEEDDS